MDVIWREVQTLDIWKRNPEIWNFRSSNASLAFVLLFEYFNILGMRKCQNSQAANAAARPRPVRTGVPAKRRVAQPRRRGRRRARLMDPLRDSWTPRSAPHHWAFMDPLRGRRGADAARADDGC